MKSCPPTSQSGHMIIASSSLLAYGVRGKGYVTASGSNSLTSSTRSSFPLGHLSKQELCESWIASTFRDKEKETNSPHYKGNVGKYFHQLNRHLKRVRLVSSCLPHSTRSRGHLEALNEFTLEGLRVTGLQVKKNRDFRSRYPKEDSENRARRYLVKVDQHLEVNTGGGTAKPRYREALPLTKSRALKGNNSLHHFSSHSRHPVVAQRDYRSLKVDHRHQQKERQNKLTNRRDRHSNRNQHSTKAIENKKPSERKKIPNSESPKTLVSTDEIPLITIENLPLETSTVCPQLRTPPIEKEEQEKEKEENLKNETLNRNDQSENFPPTLIPKESDPRVVFTVTVRTSQRQQQIGKEVQHSYSQESPKQPATLPGTQVPYLGVFSSAHVSLLTTTTVRGSSPTTTTTPGHATCRLGTPPRSSQLQAGRRHVVKHRSDISSARYITPRSGLVPQSATQHRTGHLYSPPAEGKALAVQQFQLTLPFDKELYHCESSACNSQQCLSPIAVSPVCVTSSVTSRSDFKLGLPTQKPSEMANETETQQNLANSQVNGQVKHIKGYRKKGLVSEKVLLERLSDMSIEDDLLNPVITLSSVEDDDDSPMDEGSPTPMKGTLKKSLSLAVPSLNLAEEPKRPPL